MRSAINNYKVKSLLLSGDYICSNEAGDRYLLSPCAADTFNTQELATFRTPAKHVVFPEEIALLSQESTSESYACYLLGDDALQCRTRSSWMASMQKRAKYILLQLSYAVCEGICNRPELKGSLEQCLDVENLWINRQTIQVLWVKRTKKPEASSDACIIKRLGELFYFVLYGKIYSMTPQPKSVFTIKQGPLDALVLSMLQGKVKLNQLTTRIEDVIEKMRLVTECPPSRYEHRADHQQVERKQQPLKRRSIEHTELTIKRSFDMVQSRKRPQRLIERMPANKNSYVPAASKATICNQSFRQQSRYSRYLRHNILTYSEALRLSDQRMNKGKAPQDRIIDSFRYQQNLKQKQKQNSPESQSLRTDQSVSSEISRMLKERALKAYRKEVSPSIFEEEIRDSPMQKQTQDRPTNCSLIRYSIRRESHRVNTQHSNYSKTSEQKESHLRPRLIKPSPKIALDKKLLNYLQRQSQANKAADCLISSQRFQSLCLSKDTIDRKEQRKRPNFHYRRPAADALPKINPFIFNSAAHNNEPESDRSADGIFNNLLVSKMLTTQQAQQLSSLHSVVREQKESAELTVKVRNRSHQSRQSQALQQPQRDLVQTKQLTDVISNTANRLQAIPPSVACTNLHKAQEDRQPQFTTKILESRPMSVQAPCKIDPKQANEQVLLQRAFNAPLNLPQDDQLEVIQLSRPNLGRPVTVIPTKIIQAPPIDTEQISKQINDYIELINMIGFAGGQPYKSVRNIPNLNPFVSVYFIYKRFFLERKKIEHWLTEGELQFCRPGRQKLEERSYGEWLKSTEKEELQKKVVEDNKRIENSIKSMHTKIKKENSSNELVLRLSNLNVNPSFEETSLAIRQSERVIYQLVELDELTGQMLLHIINILDALFIISELDGRLVRFVTPALRKKGLEDANEYIVEQEAKLPFLKKIYKIS